MATIPDLELKLQVVDVGQVETSIALIRLDLAKLRRDVLAFQAVACLVCAAAFTVLVLR